MELADKVVAVTGGGSGIGQALCLRLAEAGARGVAVADIDGASAEAVATSIRATGASAIAVPTDVTSEAEIATLVGRTEAEYGPIDLFCSNAGIALGGGPEVADADWARIWAVNVMAHIYAARLLVPAMRARGGGYLCNTASAAGLLTNLGSAPYSVTKHAAVAFAEWLAITYGDDGIGVSCLCPQGVRTPMLLEGLASDDPAGTSVLAGGGMLEPHQVADAVVEALAEERFFVLPHPQVAEYYRHRATDPERWLRGMRRLWAQYRKD